jgi:uncharacterized protein (TIGR00725 family)
MDLHNKKTQYLVYNGPEGTLKGKGHLKITIGVSGARDTGICGGVHAFDQAKELGREIIRQGGLVLIGASDGFPLWAASGAKEEHGIVIGISPAANEREHIDIYRNPIEYMDTIIYTGFGYSGGDLMFGRSCDALIVGCGRIGTLHEFTIAVQEKKIVGVLEGKWSTGDTIRQMMIDSGRPLDTVMFDTDPKALVEKIMAKVHKSKHIQ